MVVKDAGGPQEATGKDAANHERSLSELLTSARESRRLSAAEAAAQARVPAHYLRMLEAGDYSLISDQLYLLPFLRRYATFLALDADNAAMRFVREVQGAESYPIKAPESPQPPPAPRRARGWLTTVAVALIVLLALYLAGIGRHRAADHDPGETQVPTKPNS